MKKNSRNPVVSFLGFFEFLIWEWDLDLRPGIRIELGTVSPIKDHLVSHSSSNWTFDPS